MTSQEKLPEISNVMGNALSVERLTEHFHPIDQDTITEVVVAVTL